MEGFVIMIAIFVGFVLLLVAFLIKKIYKVLQNTNQSKTYIFTNNPSKVHLESDPNNQGKFEAVPKISIETTTNSDNKDSNESRIISMKSKRILNKLIEKNKKISVIPKKIEIVQQISKNDRNSMIEIDPNILSVKSTNEGETVTNDM
jgi:hypothetical protein